MTSADPRPILARRMGGILLFLGLVLLGYAPRPVGAAPDRPVDAPGVLRHALAAACDAADMGPRDPGWRAAELKKAILARARRSPFHPTPVVRHGWIPYPQEDG